MYLNIYNHFKYMVPYIYLCLLFNTVNSFYTPVKKQLKLNRFNSYNKVHSEDIENIHPLSLNIISQNITTLNKYEKAKSMMNISNGFGFISTISQCKNIDKYPYTSIVPFSIDPYGNPFFYLSNSSKHSKNVLKCNKISFCVLESGFKNSDDTRLCFIGDLRVVNNQTEIHKLKENYIKKHPNLSPFSFMDFKVYILDTIDLISHHVGFTEETILLIEKYYNTSNDNISLLSDSIIKGINNRNNFIISTIKIFLKKEFQLKESINYDDVTIKNIDKYGINLRLSYKYHTILVTIPFNRKINNIHDLTDNIKYLFNTYK